MLLPLLHLSACGDRKFRGSTPEGQTPIFEADASVAPLEGREGTLPTQVGMETGTLMGVFPAADVVPDSFRFTINTQLISTEFELKDIFQEQRQVYQQVPRDDRTENFQQGRPIQGRQDVFDQQAKKGSVDILVVIDNSISMTEEQRNLSDKMHELVASLGNSDWQIGVISTTAVMENGEPQCDMKVIRSTEADAAEKFRLAVLAGTSGDSNEQGILQSVVGLSCPARPWLRSYASVAVLIVSDEDNCSADGADCRGSVAENENYLIQYVEGTLGREIGKNAGFYGIFSPPSSPCQTSPNVGLQYQRLVDYKAQGMVNHGNICDASYKTTLNRISDNIAILLGSEFELKEKPLPGSLRLKLVLSNASERVLDASEYSLDERTIRFSAGHEPPAGARLIADYQVAGQALWKTVTLTEKPAAGTVEVRINGEILPARHYRENGKVLEFEDMPPADAQVRVNYAADRPLTRTFSLASPAVDDSLEVTVNGQPTEAYAVDARGLEITMDPAPSYGAVIQMSWTRRVGPQLSYALPLTADGSDYQIMDGTLPLPFTENAGVFTIPAAVHRPGKTLTLRYQVPDARMRTFSLGHVPIPGSAQLDWEGSPCLFGAGLEVEGDQLISRCGVRTRTEFVVHYQYYEPRSEFTLAAVKNPEAGQWTVWINGVPTVIYKREGATFTFPTPLDPTAQVGLEYKGSVP
ncbi:MAG TPA: hypothetical protein VFO10_26700 [Oligoflexus sp.]|uniref:hypothetical protein n=1 Tax=Oligoflexus sp. TaxID=1971216 RepID=UPI002D7EE382|nr:hypothetical protein [Oligoflexus sp.]HET9240883.1 hypothetical protein [Oligoflexus sp.]